MLSCFHTGGHGSIFITWEMEAEGSLVQGGPWLGRVSLSYPSPYLEATPVHQQSTLILGNTVNDLPDQRRAWHTLNLWRNPTLDECLNYLKAFRYNSED